MEQIKKDLQILCAAEGVGGQTAITDAAVDLLKPLVDEVEVDVMGNVLGLRRADRADAPTLMLEASVVKLQCPALAAIAKAPSLVFCLP